MFTYLFTNTIPNLFTNYINEHCDQLVHQLLNQTILCSIQFNLLSFRFVFMLDSLINRVEPQTNYFPVEH